MIVQQETTRSRNLKSFNSLVDYNLYISKKVNPVDFNDLKSKSTGVTTTCVAGPWRQGIMCQGLSQWHLSGIMWSWWKHADWCCGSGTFFTRQRGLSRVVPAEGENGLAGSPYI